MNTIQSLKELYVKLGGSLTDTYSGIAGGIPVSDYTVIPDMIQAVKEIASSGEDMSNYYTKTETNAAISEAITDYNFIVTCTIGTDGNITADKTISEVNEAVNSGKKVICKIVNPSVNKYGEIKYPLVIEPYYIGERQMGFAGIAKGDGYYDLYYVELSFSNYGSLSVSFYINNVIDRVVYNATLTGLSTLAFADDFDKEKFLSDLDSTQRQVWLKIDDTTNGIVYELPYSAKYATSGGEEITSYCFTARNVSMSGDTTISIGESTAFVIYNFSTETFSTSFSAT